jgi:Zn-dependent protease
MEKKGFSWAGVAAILFKVGPKLAKILSTLLKGGKVIKGTLFATSAASYTMIFGWKVAIMILLLLFLHEGGHLWAMKKRGMKTKGMYFIPFLGAAAVTEEEFPSREAENFVALMGPTVGLILSVLAYLVFALTGDLEFIAAAGWMAMINLINLLPIMPLDGGRVLRSISFSFGSWRGLLLTGVGMIIGAAILVKMGFWLFVILIPVGILEIVFDFMKERKRPQELLDAQRRLEELRERLRKSGDAAYSRSMYYQSMEKDMEERVKKLSLRPNMSASQLIIGIIWALALATSLFFAIHYASIIAGDTSFIDILK